MLTPDIDQTQEVDLVRLDIERSLLTAKWIVEHDEYSEPMKAEAKAMMADLEKAISEYVRSESAPVAIIGFVPIRKLTSLRNREYFLNRDKGPINTGSDLDERVEIQREYARWGIKGHANLDFDFEAEEEACGGKKHKVASAETIDVYERLGLLSLLSDKVIEFNTLSDAKKKASLLRHGTTA